MCSSLKSKTKTKTMCIPSLKNHLLLMKVAHHLSLQRDMIFLLMEGFISIFKSFIYLFLVLAALGLCCCDAGLL